MKKIITILTAALLFSCTSKKTSTPTVGEEYFLGTYIAPNGNKIPSEIYRRINKFQVTLQDGKQAFVYDTIWGRPATIYVTDSITHRPKIDSAGYPIISKDYVAIHKDSINLHVENIPLRLLLAPNTTKK